MRYPEDGLFPEWVWTVMTDVGLVVAVVAFFSALLWLWQRGPGFLVKYGPEWTTTLGEWWHGKRGGTDAEDS